MAETYQPLATKYRPQTFSDVVGQEVPTTTLLNAIKANRISHAYLFSGMRGVGKTTTARLLAKSLNCHAGQEPTMTPCGECDSCLEITNGRSIDVLEIDAASNTSVDDVRALQDTLIYKPARDRYKVYIVDEVHMLSKSAFNAFLKTLEEPPPHVVFIFATTEMNKIPPTVLSRCLVFDFGRVSSKSIGDRLKWICENEGLKAEEAAIDLIVFQSEGSIRDAISALDQVINFAGGSIEYEHALQALGLIDREVMLRLTDAVMDENAEKCFELINSIADKGADMRLFARHLIRHVRDLMIIKVGGKNRDLLPYSDAEMTELLHQSSKLSPEDLSRFFDILVKADSEMQHAATPQYHLEAAVVKMIHSTRLVPLTDLIKQLQTGEIVQPVAKPTPMPKEQNLGFEPPKQTAVEPRPDIGGDPKAALTQACAGTPVQALVKLSDAVNLDGNTVIISVSSSAQVTLLSSGPNKGFLQDAAQKIFGEKVEVEVKNNSSTPAVDKPPASFNEPVPIPQEEPQMGDQSKPNKPATASNEQGQKTQRILGELNLTLLDD